MTGGISFPTLAEYVGCCSAVAGFAWATAKAWAGLASPVEDDLSAPRRPFLPAAREPYDWASEMRALGRPDYRQVDALPHRSAHHGSREPVVDEPQHRREAVAADPLKTQVRRNVEPDEPEYRSAA